MALDVAAGLRVGDPDRDMLLMLGVLCHDFGKPATTEDREGRIVSYRHDLEGIPPTGRFLSRMRAAHALVRGVSALVRDHLAPAQFFREAGPRGYRRLLRRLRDEGVDADLLWRVARADHLGRTTEDAASGRFEAGDVFRERAQAVDRDPHTYQAVVSGRHLLEQGVAPGPELGALLERCREIQDETGWTDADAILERARSG
jgi:tRNA nucleotidyltransferase (CCA-adding enzyme)